jgi:transketolase
MNINKASIKMWSRIGPRAAFGLAALELGKNIDDLFILTGDTSTSAGLDRFKNTFPEKFLDTGIAEQNMIGIASGLSSEGFNVITSTFSPFQTMRCCEQIRMNLGYMKHKVCMVGLASGLVLGPLGYSHCCIEDVSIIRSIPGITVISPADSGETVKAVLAAAHYNESVYIRLTGGANNPIVYQEDYKYEIGKAVTLKEGKDVTIIAAGTMVYESIKTAEILDQNGISTKVINMHTIKPLDKEAITVAAKTSKLIVTIEEHSIIGGLGSAVSQHLVELKKSPRLQIIGLSDEYGNAGSYKDLLEQSDLTAHQLAKNIEHQFIS